MKKEIYFIGLIFITIGILLEIFVPQKLHFVNMLLIPAVVFFAFALYNKKTKVLNLNKNDIQEEKNEKIKSEIYEKILEIYNKIELGSEDKNIDKAVEKIGSALERKNLEIEKYKAEAENYQKELTASYNNLLAKSTEIEYSNMMLEQRVTRISALNAVGKAVLSELEMERIISTILDSYIVLIFAKKIVLYLFEDEVLVQKAMRGSINLKDNPDVKPEDIVGGKESRYYGEYIKKAKMIIEDNEIVIISELKVKGKELGVLFIVEEKNEESSIKKEEMDMIAALNIYASIAMNNASVYKELADKQRLEKEVGIARDIQMSLLPKDIKSVFGLEIANHFEPAKEVGGDYYDYFISAEGKFGIAIGDVSGKGMPAALLMTTIRAILRTIASYDLLPDIVMTRLNNVIFQDINEEMFVTLFYSLYDYETATMFFSNAGHNPVIIYDSANEKVIERNVKGTAIGFSDNYNFKLDKIKLSYNDVLVFYTDGITEAENVAGDLFGIDRLKKCVEELKDLSSEKIKKGILAKVDEFRDGYIQVDDITLVVLKYKGWV